MAVLLLTLLSAAFFLFRASLLGWAGRALVEDDPPQKADCILVLGGDDFGLRIIKGAQLASAGYAPYVLVDGPASLLGHQSDDTIQFAEKKGYPKSLFRAVWLPPGVDSTATEVQYVANNVFQKGHVRTVLLVTSNYHTRRAAHLLRSVAPWLNVIAVGAPDPFFSPDSWWKNRNGKKTFLLEWTKTITEWWGI